MLLLMHFVYMHKFHNFVSIPLVLIVNSMLNELLHSLELCSIVVELLYDHMEYVQVTDVKEMSKENKSYEIIINLSFQKKYSIGRLLLICFSFLYRRKMFFFLLIRLMKCNLKPIYHELITNVPLMIESIIIPVHLEQHYLDE